MASATQIQEIVGGSQSRGLDPYAVLAVAEQEGLGGGIGDSGSSFGPWQLHVGGAFPSSVNGVPTAAWSQQQKNAWAWSQAGLNYALDRIAGVANHQSGADAVHSIVYQFERPADPSKEYTNAVNAYQGLYYGTGATPSKIASVLSGSRGGIGGALSSVGGAIQGAESAVAGAASVSGLDVLGGVGKGIMGGVEGIVIRGLMILGGTLVALVGLYFIVRAFGLGPGPTQIVAPIAAKVPGAGSAGAAAASTARRKGDAEASRGGEVTRTGSPEKRTRSDKRQERSNARERARREKLGTDYGDVPF